jgi:hypothetical protein
MTAAGRSRRRHIGSYQIIPVAVEAGANGYLSNLSRPGAIEVDPNFSKSQPKFAAKPNEVERLNWALIFLAKPFKHTSVPWPRLQVFVH